MNLISTLFFNLFSLVFAIKYSKIPADNFEKAFLLSTYKDVDESIRNRITWLVYLL